jgi:hypothetical protein
MSRMQAHPMEQTLGRVRKDGGIDRRYRMARLVLDPWPSSQAAPAEPVREDITPLKIAGLTLYLIVIFAMVIYSPVIGAWIVDATGDAPSPAPVVQAESELIR